MQIPVEDFIVNAFVEIALTNAFEDAARFGQFLKIVSAARWVERAILGIRKATNRIARLFDELHDVVREVKIFLWILDSFGDLEMFLCLQQGIDDHVLYGICYRSANANNEQFLSEDGKEGETHRSCGCICACAS